MRKNGLPKVLLLAAFIVMPAAIASAQDAKTAEPSSDAQQPVSNQQRDVRGNMLRQLGLSREQIQQIRRMNQERKPLMDEAQQRFREANRALDAAIYADDFSDADFYARLKDVQMAQTEIQRIRFVNELAVRRILTSEQLVRFRELRRRFEQTRDNFEKGPPFKNTQPMERPPAANDLRQPVTNRQTTPPPARAVPQTPNQ